MARVGGGSAGRLSARNSSTAPLAGNASFVGEAEDTAGWKSATVFAYSDAAPQGLRSAIITLDRSLGYPIIGLLSKVLG